MEVDNCGKDTRLSLVGIDSLALKIRKPLELSYFIMMD